MTSDSGTSENVRGRRLSPSLLADPVHLLALGFGTGLSPKAPGTAGSLLAVPMLWLLSLAPMPWRVLVVAAAIGLGIWLCGASARKLGEHDHPGIVFDEIAAMLALSLALPPGLPALACAFGLFRLFDILKPWPIRDLDHRLHGGLGIMLDDLMAAIYTSVCLSLIFSLQHVV